MSAPTLYPRICRALSLGQLTAVPHPLSGGYTHRMIALTTTQGQYAVKLLNPEIMQRPDALANYARAEQLEALLEEHHLPILPALTIAGRKLHCVDSQYLYVYDYFDGHILSDAEITPDHCTIMGDALARIHAVARRAGSEPAEAPAPIDWRGLTDALLACPDHRAEGEAMQAALPMLQRITQAAEEAAAHLPRRQALCHNDMDPKNVLWRGDDFRIIDLECLDWADPMQELLDLAITWAGNSPDEERFKAFLSAYRAAGGDVMTDAARYYNSRRNYLDWLAYNVRRACFADPEERHTAREQITATLRRLTADQQNRKRILQWVEEI